MGMKYIDGEMLKKAFLAGAKGLEAKTVSYTHLAYEDEFSILIRLFGFRLFKPVEESREDAEEMLVHAMEVFLLP